MAKNRIHYGVAASDTVSATSNNTGDTAHGLTGSADRQYIRYPWRSPGGVAGLTVHDLGAWE